MHMLGCILTLHIYGTSCGLTRFYRLIMGDENIGANRFIFTNRFGFKMKITFAVHVFQFVVIYIPWAIYVWINISGFGAQPECNDLAKYVVVFVSVRATVGWLRIVAIVSFSMSVLTLLFGLSTMLFVRRYPTVAGLSDQAPDAAFGRFFVVLLVRLRRVGLLCSFVSQ